MSGFGIGKMTGVSAGNSSFLQRLGGPDWEKIPHKGMKRPTEAEFEGIIDKLAKSLAEARYDQNDNKYRNIRSMAEKATAQYVSVVSPDRKALAKEASRMSRPNSSPKNTEDPKNLIDYLNIKDGIGAYPNEGCARVMSQSGATVVFSGSDLQPDTFEIKSGPLGQTVMGCAAGSWYYVATPQEQAMEQNFLTRLNAAEDQYYRQYLNSGSPAYAQKENTLSSTPSDCKFDVRI